jgi:hypothetical protein
MCSALLIARKGAHPDSAAPQRGNQLPLGNFRVQIRAGRIRKSSAFSSPRNRVNGQTAKSQIFYSAVITFLRDYGASPCSLKRKPRAKDGPPVLPSSLKRLIEANLWIALGTAMHFLNRGLSPIDLIQEGNIGLMRAVNEYNHLRAYRFSIYATWWVRKAIIRDMLVPVPTSPVSALIGS